MTKIIGLGSVVILTLVGVILMMGGNSLGFYFMIPGIIYIIK